MSAPQPRMTISCLESDGVTIICSSDPGFERAFKPGRAKGFDALLPYAVVIRNDTDRPVVAYSVIWKCTDSDGTVKNGLRNAFDTALTPDKDLLPQSTRIVSLSWDLEAGGQSWDEGTEAGVNELVTTFSRYSAIHIALDAVLFSDGRAVGPDEAHCILRWKAWNDAQKEVLTKALQSAPAELPAMLRELAEPGSAIYRQHSQREVKCPADLWVVSTRSNSYAECVELARGYFALTFLDQLEERGAPTIDDLQLSLRRRFLQVHR